MRVFSQGPTGPPAKGVSGLGAAILPVPAQLVQAYQSWGPVTGMPRANIPAPYPAAVPQGVDHVVTDPTSTSKDAGPVWHPGIYFQPGPASRFPGATESDNQMPVPALAPSAKAAIAARNPVWLRQKQVGWPITLPKYLNRS